MQKPIPEPTIDIIEEPTESLSQVIKRVASQPTKVQQSLGNSWSQWWSSDRVVSQLDSLTIEELEQIPNECALQLYRLKRNMVTLARIAGESLKRIKRQVGHGNWLPWLKNNFQGSKESAALYMRVAENWEHIKDMNLTDAPLTKVRDSLPPERVRTKKSAPRITGGSPTHQPKRPAPDVAEDPPIKVLKLTVEPILSKHWLKTIRGQYIGENYIRLRIGGSPVDIFKTTGEPLLMYRPAAIPVEICDNTLPILRKLGSQYSEHRGFNSGVAGAIDDKRECRLTKFTIEHIKEMPEVWAFAEAIDKIFKKEAPERYSIQRGCVREVKQSRPDLINQDLAFSNVTANLWSDNHNARTPVHVDRGDLPEGFGVMSVIRRGNYKGGELIFPKYGIAVDLQTTDVLLADVHEYHGNNDIETLESGWERISTIHYFRTGLRDCPAKHSDQI